MEWLFNGTIELANYEFVLIMGYVVINLVKDIIRSLT